MAALPASAGILIHDVTPISPERKAPPAHAAVLIEDGKRAGLLLLAENPLTDVSACDSIPTVFPNGAPIARESLAPAE